MVASIGSVSHEAPIPNHATSHDPLYTFSNYRDIVYLPIMYQPRYLDDQAGRCPETFIGQVPRLMHWREIIASNPDADLACCMVHSFILATIVALAEICPGLDVLWRKAENVLGGSVIGRCTAGVGL